MKAQEAVIEERRKEILEIGRIADALKVEEHIYQEGVKCFFEKHVYTFCNMVYVLVGDDGSKELMPYDEFLHSVVRSLPDDVSMDAFCSYFDQELRSLYESSCSKALEREGD